MRNVFGWDLPPGCTQRQVDEAFGREEPCAVCGQMDDACICPECPTCGSVGDLECYDGATYCSWCGKKPAGHRATPETCSGCYAAAAGGNHTTFEDRPSHGLSRSQEQIELRAEAERQWREAAEAEAAAEAAMFTDEEYDE